MTPKKISERAGEQIRGLTADLELIEKLNKVRTELVALDNKCIFVEGVYGREHAAYRDAHVARDHLLLSADKLVQDWLAARRHEPAPNA